MKTISVPLTVEAMNRLDFDECLPGDLEEIDLSEDEFTALLKTNIIENINSTLGIFIDEYEDEKIQGISKLEASLKIFQEAFKNTKCETIKKIIKLNESAIQKNTGLFFYF
ncbi:hypothetical protein ACXR0M_15145 [Pseudomonas sp. Eth.TT006]